MSDDTVALVRIGWGPFFADQLTRLEPGLVPARIAIAHGESYVAGTEAGAGKAMIVGRRIAEWQSPADRPCVGDWVVGARSAQLGALLIAHRLERRTCLARQAVAARPERQVIAANVDVVGVVSALGDTPGMREMSLWDGAAGAVGSPGADGDRPRWKRRLRGEG